MPVTTSITTVGDLRKIVREYADESDLANPAELAEAMIDDGIIPSSDYEAALRITLPDFVREQLRSVRAMPIAKGDGNGRKKNPANVQAGHHNKSGLWSAVEKLYHDRISVGGRWILLRDATRSDIETARDDYYARAASNTRMGDRFDKVVDLFKANPSAKVVPDLPKRDFLDIFAT